MRKINMTKKPSKYLVVGSGRIVLEYEDKGSRIREYNGIKWTSFKDMIQFNKKHH